MADDDWKLGDWREQTRKANFDNMSLYPPEDIMRQYNGSGIPAGLGEWDAGDDAELPPPRGWLLGNVFCRRFMSSLLADGAVGKTALRYAQLFPLATGNPLTGEHVFQRCRVLIVSLEDDVDELRRRILAARLHYNIDLAELKGWLFLAAPGAAGGKLMTSDNRAADSRKPCRQARKRHHGTGNRHHQSRPVREVAFGRGEYE